MKVDKGVCFILSMDGFGCILNRPQLSSNEYEDLSRHIETIKHLSPGVHVADVRIVDYDDDDAHLHDNFVFQRMRQLVKFDDKGNAVLMHEPIGRD